MLCILGFTVSSLARLTLGKVIKCLKHGNISSILWWPILVGYIHLFQHSFSWPWLIALHPESNIVHIMCTQLPKAYLPVQDGGDIPCHVQFLILTEIWRSVFITKGGKTHTWWLWMGVPEALCTSVERLHLSWGRGWQSLWSRLWRYSPLHCYWMSAGAGHHAPPKDTFT